MADHALGHQACEGLVPLQIPGVAKRAHEETGIEKMQNRMLDAADILVDRHPVGRRLARESLRMMRVGKSQEIPRALEEGVEGVLLADGVAAACRATDMLPCRMV